MTVLAKICGLSTPESVQVAVEHGADYIGFVHFPASPRHVSAEQMAGLAALAPMRVVKVAVMVDPDDVTLDALLAQFTPDYIQLHGKESAARVDAIKLKYGIPAIKAVAVSTHDEVAHALRDYADVANIMMFDAKPPKDSTLPGGNGVSFDWSILQDHYYEQPVMLSGGLNAANVAQAVQQSGIRIVDVSSGVESAPGVKDPQRIADFLRIVKSL